MKWTKVTLILAVPALVLLLLSGSMRSPAVEAKPTSIVTITNTLCLVLTATEGDWDGDNDVDADDGTRAMSQCNTLNTEAALRNLVTVLGGDPDNPEPEDFAAVDVDAGHLHEDDGTMFILAFVTNDAPVTFYADEGEFGATGHASIACGPMAMPGYDFQEEDCDDDGIRGDGVVAVKLIPGDGDRGPAIVRARQGMLEIEEEYTIVGEPWNIEFTILETTVQAGAPDCVMFAGTEDFPVVHGMPEKSVFLAEVTDDDGTPITGALVTFQTDDEEKAVTALPLAPTLDLGALGAGAPNVLCGTADPGTITITAAITDGMAELGVALDPGARMKDTDTEFTVQGMPTDMLLSADPPSLVCDGTNSSTVSASLTDAEGNPAVDGTPVRFEAKALGTVDPITALSAGGAATTAVTPLSGIAGGVVVRAMTMLQAAVDWQYLFANLDDFNGEEGDECENLVDDDGDGLLNDGCPADGAPETGTACTEGAWSDQDLDGEPPWGPADNDNDGLANDGCPPAGDWRNVHTEEFPLADVELEGTILVQCSEAAPLAPEPAAPAPPAVPVISPPPTGDGGCLP